MLDTSLSAIEKSTLGKISRRLVSFIFVLFILNSIDRVNLSFAALQMNSDLGLTPIQYGMAASIFFVSYLLFQIPSVMLGRKVGVRVWLGLMLVVWGLGATALAWCNSLVELSALRLLIGLAEAGFAPLTLYYYSCWIPKRHRGRATSKNVLAIAVSIVIGAPLSGWLIDSFHQVYGFAGWQWMFIVEGLPTVLLGVMTFFYLPNRPADARWLSAQERTWLEGELAKERVELERTGLTSFIAVLTNLRVWACAGAWFSLTMGVYGVIFWLPQAIKQLSAHSVFVVATLSALPWIGAAAGMIYNARHSDLAQERYWHVIIPALIGAAGLAASVSLSAGLPAYLMLMVGLAGLGAAQAVFWTIPMAFMAGAGAAGGLALVNLIGNTAGLVGPNLIAWLRTTTGTFSSAGYLLAGFLTLGAALLFGMSRAKGPQPAGDSHVVH